MTRATFVPEATRVADELREQIIDGRRPEGSRLVERDLAAELRVSRVPVREALRLLVAEGLATPHPRTFTTVRSFTAADVEELIEVRSAVETLTFRLAAQRRTPAALARLRALVDREVSAAIANDAAAARRAGADFHREIVAAAGNQVLAELDRVTGSRMRWLLYQHADLVEMAREHRALLDAVSDEDPDVAAHLAVQHLETSRRSALAVRAPEE